MSQLQFHSVSFTYDSLADPLIALLSFTAPAGWTGIVGPNGVGKSTLLRLATGALRPHRGHVAAPRPAVVLQQRTDDPPEGLEELLGYSDAEAGRLISVLGLAADWPWRWESLSHGERKRAQIGAALYARPELLAVDEPTNHLDAQARAMVTEALSRFTGVGLIVSHDRELLDALCAQCLFFSQYEPPVMRPGGVTAGLEQQDHDRRSRAAEYDRVVAAERRIVAEEQRRRADASLSRQNAMRSKRGLAPKDSDAREKIDRARISGADGNAGRALNQLAGRVEQARAAREQAARPVRERTGVTLRGERSGSDRLVHLESRRLSLGPERVLEVPELLVTPGDRIGLVGANGTGKTTLIREVCREAAHLGERLVVVPQELAAEEAARLQRQTLAMENEPLGRVISTVSRLGSDPEKLLETGSPSPGEARKLLLALGFEHNPHLVIMDEPTNHLDLVSIRCLEEALDEYAGALLLVSHDRRFLEALTSQTWEIRRSAEGSQLFTL